MARLRGVLDELLAAGDRFTPFGAPSSATKVPGYQYQDTLPAYQLDHAYVRVLPLHSSAPTGATSVPGGHLHNGAALTHAGGSQFYHVRDQLQYNGLITVALAVGGKVILTSPCVLCMENH